MQESNQTASSSLTYGSTKHSNRLQPTLVTINAEQKVSAAGSTAAEHRGLSSSLSLCEPQGCPKAGDVLPSRPPAQPLGTHSGKMLMQWSGAGGRNARHRGRVLAAAPSRSLLHQFISIQGG